MAILILLSQATHVGYVRASNLLESPDSAGGTPAAAAATAAYRVCLNNSGVGSFADYATLLRKRDFPLGQAYWRRSTFDASQVVGRFLFVVVVQ